MNFSLETIKQTMQIRRKPSAQTVRRVSAGAVLLVAFALSCTISFTSLCANLNASEDTVSTTESNILNDVDPTHVSAFEVYVQYDGETYTYQTTGCKAGEAVYALGLNTDNASFALDPPAKTVLTAGDTVRVLPCSTVERIVTEEIPYEVDTVKDDRLYTGQSRILSAGKNGEKEIVYRDRYVGEKRVSTETVSVTVTAQPVSATKAVGTRKINIKSGTPISNLRLPEDFQLKSDGTPAKYRSYFDGVATAYYGGGITSTGVPAAVGYVAVNPKVIPYGTKMWITSLDGEVVYGYAIAADTGGFAKGGWADVDLYMNTYNECVQFGKRGVRIYIL